MQYTINFFLLSVIFMFSPLDYQPWNISVLHPINSAPVAELNTCKTVPIANNNISPTNIGTPVFCTPLTRSASPFSFPVLIASHAYFANINPAPTNASVRINLNMPCISAISSHIPPISPAANAGVVNAQIPIAINIILFFKCVPLFYNKEPATGMAVGVLEKQFACSRRPLGTCPCGIADGTPTQMSG